MTLDTWNKIQRAVLEMQTYRAQLAFERLNGKDMDDVYYTINYAP